MGASDPILTRRALDEAVEDLFYSGNAFVVDVETKGRYRLDPRRNEVFWVGFAGPGGRSVIIPCGHPVGRINGETKEPREDRNGKTRWFRVPTFTAPPAQLRVGEVMEAIRPLFWSSMRIVGHNVKFDIESCAKYWGELPPGPYDDTQMTEFLLNENRHQYSLDKICERRLGVKMDKSISAEVEKHPFAVAARYLHLDVRRDWQIWKDTFWRLRGEGFLDPVVGEHSLWRTEEEVLEALAHMETRGILLDRDEAVRVDDNLEKWTAEVKRELYRIAGRVWNLDSNPQKQAVFYGKKSEGGQGLRPLKKTKGGAPSCDDEALKEHVGNPLVDAYMEYGDLTKMRTYTGSWLGTVERKAKNKNKNDAPGLGDDGRIHANFKPHGAKTGRLSCSEPNLQNIPKAETDLGKQIRGMFIREPGRMLLVADYAQIEYVVLAHFSQDPELIRYFEQGLNFHYAVASRLLQKPIEDITKPEYSICKNTNFATVYGAGDEQVARMSGVTVEYAQEFRRMHKRMLPRVYRFTDDVVRVCKGRRPPHVKTLLGRKRRLPEIFAQNDQVRLRAERQAVNAVIQGSAADLNKLALVRLFRTAPDWMWTLLNVHDEFVVSVPEDRVEEGSRILERAMVGPGIGDLMAVPLRTDVKAVDRWSEAKD